MSTSTLSFFYPDVFNEPQGFSGSKELRLPAAIVLYSEENKPLAMFWLTFDQWMSGAKTLLQTRFKQKAQHEESGLYTWRNLDTELALSTLKTYEQFFSKEDKGISK